MHAPCSNDWSRAGVIATFAKANIHSSAWNARLIWRTTALWGNRTTSIIMIMQNLAYLIVTLTWPLHLIWRLHNCLPSKCNTIRQRWWMMWCHWAPFIINTNCRWLFRTVWPPNWTQNLHGMIWLKCSTTFRARIAYQKKPWMICWKSQKERVSSQTKG